jgi:hypothetical protein
MSSPRERKTMYAATPLKLPVVVQCAKHDDVFDDRGYGVERHQWWCVRGGGVGGRKASKKGR